MCWGGKIMPFSPMIKKDQSLHDLETHMKVVISKSGPHVFFQKSRNISGTKRDMKKMKIGFRRVD